MNRTWMIPLVLAIAACGERAAEDAPVTSAATPTWTIDAEPLLEIGMVEGPPEYQFTWAMPVLRMSDGGILVGEGSAQELRMFDAAGRHTRTIGGNGEGPGEFRMISGAWLLAGDSILVHDPNLGRMSLFTASGDFVRSYLLDAAPGFAPSVVGMFDDGSTLVRPFAEGEVLAITPGVRRDTLPVSVLDRKGELVATVARLPGNEMFGEGPFMGERAFGAEGLIAVGGDVFYTASSETFRIEQRGSDGTVRHVIERTVEPLPITEEDRRRWRESRLENASGASRQFAEAFVGAMTFPETRPVLATMQVDRAGNLWVRTYAAADAPSAWLVFDAEGNEAGRVETPEGFTATDIGDDWILGTTRDDTGVPRVRLYTLNRAR